MLRSHKPKKGYRVLLWLACTYVAAHVAINAYIDLWKPELRSSWLVDVFHRLKHLEQGPDVLCLGTSRFGLAFSAPDVQKVMRKETGDASLTVFNASVAAQDFHTADFVMREVLNEGSRPDIVVIEVNTETVARRNIWFGAHVLPPVRGKRLGIYLEDFSRVAHRLPNLVADHAYPLYRCRKEIMTSLSHALEEDCSPGERRLAQSRKMVAAGPGAEEAEAHSQGHERFLNGDQSLESRARTAEGLPTISRWLDSYELGGLSTWSLERLIRRCQAHGATVILVSAPLTTDHRALFTPKVEAAFVAYMHHLEREYHCQFVDCRDRLPDHVFHDNHHVRKPEGSRPFSVRLAREILAPAWLARR